MRIRIGGLIETWHVGTRGTPKNGPKLPEAISQVPSHVRMHDGQMRKAKHSSRQLADIEVRVSGVDARRQGHNEGRQLTLRVDEVLDQLICLAVSRDGHRLNRQGHVSANQLTGIDDLQHEAGCVWLDHEVVLWRAAKQASAESRGFFGQKPDGDFGRPNPLRHGLVRIVRADGPDFGTFRLQLDAVAVSATRVVLERLVAPRFGRETAAATSLRPSQDLGNRLPCSFRRVVVQHPAGHTQYLMLAHDTRHALRKARQGVSHLVGHAVNSAPGLSQL